jgi:hypothetical protein
MVLVDYIGIFLHFRILLTDDDIFVPYEHKNYSQTQTQLSFSSVCFEKWNFRKISAEIFL